MVIPPRANALESHDAYLSSQQALHIAAINADGRMKWQVATGYGKRALIETEISRYKSVVGRRLWARSFAAQQTEVALGCDALNQVLACASPKSVRCNKATVQRATIKDGNSSAQRSVHQRRPRCLAAKPKE